jgi:septum site-determining protein MinC
MKRLSRKKRQRLSVGSSLVSSRRSRATRAVGPRHLRALSKTELVALVLKLQAEQAAAKAAADAVQSGPTEAAVMEPAAPEEAARPTGLVIDSSVRSGQTIEFPGDVTVIGSVGSGAEIIAGGSIHVYGTLRGRAIAGTSGDQSARIFCQDLDAELLSIDGRYRVADNFDRTLRGRPVQARLDGPRMALTPLDPPAQPSASAGAEERATADRLRRATDRMRQFMSIGSSRQAPLAGAARG